MRVQPVVFATVFVVLVTAVLSGPAITAVDLTATDSFDGAELGDGRVTVGDLRLPDAVVFERGEFGSGSYYLRVPAVTVDLKEVVGQPILSYEVSVTDLGFTRSSVHVLEGSDEGEYELAIDEAAFGRNEISNDSYAGELSITARYGGTQHEVARRNVTIEVRE